MGRPKKSVDQHLKDGTYRQDRHGPVPAPPASDAPPVPRKPAGMTPEAGAVWVELVPLLAGAVRERDVRRLADLCAWWARFDAVTLALDDMSIGSVEYGRALIQLGICEDKVDRLGRGFGLTPESRAKIKPETPAGPPAAKVPTRPRTKLDGMGPPK